MFISANVSKFYVWQTTNIELIAFAILFLFFLNQVVTKSIKIEEITETKNDGASKLFNLFYINTPKVHEIVMLIDNKIMKTIESEQVSEELLKYSSSLSVGKAERWSAESGFSKEDNFKKRVYESFDVKTTKSIMLRKIFDTTQKTKTKRATLKLGDLTIFENIELQHRNVDDTVMLLNVLQDSKIRNDPNESLELNMSKMLERMLDDFTIDFVFTSDKQGKIDQYIIQLPYKSTDNFENGYLHNDLQLGKLSLIGIYRGEIDFSKKDSTSSKFLELLSESYHNELKQKPVTSMRQSNSSIERQDLQLEFSHQRLREKLHLIDVIAVIQELNIDKDE